MGSESGMKGICIFGGDYGGSPALCSRALKHWRKFFFFVQLFCDNWLLATTAVFLRLLHAPKLTEETLAMLSPRQIRK